MHRPVHLAIRAWHGREGGQAEMARKAMSHLAEVFPLDDYSGRDIRREYLPPRRWIREDTVGENVNGKGELYSWVGRCFIRRWKDQRCFYSGSRNRVGSMNGFVEDRLSRVASQRRNHM